MITFALTRSKRAEVISVIQAVFSRPSWRDILVTRMELVFTDAGGEVTVNVALWGHDDEIAQELEMAKII